MVSEDYSNLEAANEPKKKPIPWQMLVTWAVCLLFVIISFIFLIIPPHDNNVLGYINNIYMIIGVIVMGAFLTYGIHVNHNNPSDPRDFGVVIGGVALIVSIIYIVMCILFIIPALAGRDDEYGFKLKHCYESAHSRCYYNIMIMGIYAAGLVIAMIVGIWFGCVRLFKKCMECTKEIRDTYTIRPSFNRTIQTVDE